MKTPAQNGDAATLISPAPTVDPPQAPADAGPAATTEPSQAELAAIKAKLGGRYELGDLIGAGGVGTVYRATDLSLKRQVAIKIIRSKFRVSPRIVDRFREEALIVASLAHPNIVHIHEIVECDRMPIIVMEYVEGANLQQLLLRNSLKTDRLVDIMTSVAETVAHAHAHGIIHCDIKPENILIANDGRIKIADFGIALRMNPLAGDLEAPPEQPARTIMGSPAFMSPEQARGDVREITSTADIFGIGASLFYALSGRHIVNGSVAQMLEQLRAGNIERLSAYLPAVPKDLEAICMTCLAANPDRRYPTAYRLRDELIRYREGLPVTVCAYGILDRTRRAIRYRKRAFFIPLTALLIILAIFIAAQILQYRVARHSVMAVLKDHVRGVAEIAAYMIAPGDVAVVHSPSDQGRPEYARLVQTLDAVKARNAHVEFMYVARKAPDPRYVAFVALDSLAGPGQARDFNRNGSVESWEREAQIGALFRETPRFPAIQEAFKGPTADLDVVTLDSWRIALSGYAPVFDRDRQAIAIVGAGMTVDDLTSSFRQIARTRMVSIDLSLVAGFLLIVLILGWRMAVWERAAAAVADRTRT